MFAPRPLATPGAVNSILNLGSTDRGVAEATAPWRVGREEGGSSFEFALDLRRDAALLAAGVDLELVIGWGVVAAIAGIGDAAIEDVADERLHLYSTGGTGGVKPCNVSQIGNERGNVLEGIERMPEAFLRLLQGKNFGKQIIKIG